MIEIYHFGSVDNTILGFLVATAIAMFEVISKALPGFFNTLVAILLLALADLLRNFFNKTT